MLRRFKTVAVGGTFDELHKGHNALLLRAFQEGDHVVIGLTSDKFVKTMAKLHTTTPYKKRLNDLESFLNDKGLLKRAKAVPIDDAYGTLLQSDIAIDALVVSGETESVALKINEKRRVKGLPMLAVVVVNMVLSENHEAISTTRIRRGEIDKEGHLLKG